MSSSFCVEGAGAARVFALALIYFLVAFFAGPLVGVRDEFFAVCTRSSFPQLLGRKTSLATAVKNEKKTHTLLY